MILVALVLNVFFTLRHKYSLGGIRHSYYLFILASLLIGASLQYAHDAVKKGLAAGKGRELYEWLAAKQRPLIIFSLLCLVGAGLGIARHYGKSDYLRRYSGKSSMELPMMRADYLWAWDYIRSNVRPDDTIMATYQTMIYVFYATLDETSAEQVAGGLHKISYLGRSFYFIKEGSSGWSFDSNRKLTDALARLCAHVPVPDGSTVWIVNIGWAPDLKFVSYGPFWRRLQQRKFLLPGAAIYALNASDLKKSLSRAGAPAAHKSLLPPSRDDISPAPERPHP